MSRTVRAAATALFLATMRISAHHAFTAEYDENKVVTVSGTVTRFEWTNPHAWLYVGGKGESEKVTNWGFEMGSPNALSRDGGWTVNTMKVGMVVTVVASRAKDGSNKANTSTVTVNGKRLGGASSQGPAQ